jgi:hypothetical protein
VVALSKGGTVHRGDRLRRALHSLYFGIRVGRP